MAYDIKFKSPNAAKWYSLPTIYWIGALRLFFLQMGWKIFNLNDSFASSWNILHKVNQNVAYRIYNWLASDSGWKIWAGLFDKFFGWKIVRDSDPDWLSKNRYAYSHPVNKIITHQQVGAAHEVNPMPGRIIKANGMDKTHVLNS